MFLYYYYFDDLHYELSNSQDEINKIVQKNPSSNIYYIHNEFDGFIQNPGNDWEYVTTTELAENIITIYRVKNFHILVDIYNSCKDVVLCARMRNF